MRHPSPSNELESPSSSCDPCVPPLSRSAFAFSSHSHPLRSARLAEAAHSVTAATTHRKASQLNKPFFDRLDLLQELGGAEESVTSEWDGSGSSRHSNRRGAGGHIGHSGCVNALCWSESGQLLASGSDDTRVVLWKLGSSHGHPVAAARNAVRHRPWLGRPSVVIDHPETDPDSAPARPSLDVGMSAVIHTGHTANIFSVAFAPHSSDSRLFTAAGDSQIRVFDLNRSGGGGHRVELGTKWFDRFDQGSGGVDCRTIRCHRRRAKRLATENSPDIFLSVAEDGDVRLHDLRTHHECRSNCPRPLLHSSTSLYSLSVSPLQPYLFAVAGVSPYSYLYDRRMIGRVLQEEWGMPIAPSEEPMLTKCVRRFGLPEGGWRDANCRPQGVADPNPETPTSGSAMASAARRRMYRYRASMDQITAVKLGEKRSGDLIASYSDGGIYRFDINDEPGVLQHRTDTEALQARSTFASDTSQHRSATSCGAENRTSRPTSQKRQEGANRLEASDHRDAELDAILDELEEPDSATSTRSEDAEDGFETEEDEGEDSPTEQELNDFPLYRQLIADGEAGDLEESSSGSDDEDSDAIEESSDDQEDDDDDDDDDDEDDSSSGEGSGDTDDISPSDSELDYDPLPPSVSGRSMRDDTSLTSVPIVYPRRRYTGHLNRETVKEVNFLGPSDEYIVSGSDDGNFFVWDSESTELLGIWQGDASVVNVVVPHPTLPVVAVSGIDDSVKLFGPVDIDGHSKAKHQSDERADPRRYSRWSQRQTIVRRNERRTIGVTEAAIEGEEDDDDDDGGDDDDDDDDDEQMASRQYMRHILQSALPDDGDSEGSRLRILRQADGTVVLTRGGPSASEVDDADECSVM